MLFLTCVCLYHNLELGSYWLPVLCLTQCWFHFVQILHALDSSPFCFHVVGYGAKTKTRTSPLADVFNLVDENRNVVVEKSATPTVALDRLSGSMPESASGRAAWRANARVAAVLGSCPRSHKSFKSGDPLGSCSVC